jgi:parvulin-like peptidyl-prolyl isomerase
MQTFEKGKNEAAVNIFVMNVGDRSAIVKDNEFYKIYIVEKKYPAGIKPFEKAKSECITKYQDNLEKTWLQALEKKYPVKIDEKVFANLYKK